MAERKAPGESLSRRLMSRSAGLHRRTTPDGGEVFSGPTATKALQSLGARAMTMDHTIIVDESFDLNNPEDQALYAHEVYHQMESGGADLPTSQNDAEEAAAQAVERMVLHRSEAGDDFGSIMRDVKQRGGGDPKALSSGGGDESTTGTNKDLEVTSEAEEAYKALRKQGKTHEEIVRELAHHTMELLRQREDSSPIRQFGTTRW